MSTIPETEGPFPPESPCYVSPPALSYQQYLRMVSLFADPPSYAHYSRSKAESIEAFAVVMSSPFAFHPTATLIDLIHQAELLPQNVLSMERMMSNKRRTYLHERCQLFMAAHPGTQLTNEWLWGFSADNDIEIAGINAAVKTIKQKQPKVIERLRRLWAEETEKWRQAAAGLKAEVGGDLAKITQAHEWYLRVERVGSRLEELFGT